MRKFLWLIPVPLLVLFWLVRGWLWPPTDVVHPVRGPAVQAAYATGTVEATVMMPIASKMAGRMMALNVDEGSRVTKGQVLAQLEDEDLQYSIEQLQAQEIFAKKEYERNALLVKEHVASRQAYDQARSNWDTAVAATRAAKAQAGYLKLLAPADGLIIKRDGEVGQMIAANEPVFWLSCCAPLRISAEVDEEDIAQVKPGQPVLIRADAFPGRIFHGKVQEVTPKGDPVARSYRVRVEFSEETPLQIGMTAETNIITDERKDALLLPNSAIDKDSVWLVKDDRLVRQPVRTGAKGAAYTEIVSGVSENDLVIVKPIATLKPGATMHTRLIESPAPESFKPEAED